MKVVIISDTHLEHEGFKQLEGDVLIHCGDMFNLFEKDRSEVAAIDRWFGKQNFDLVLCTGGNHDHPLQEALLDNAQPFSNAIYLQDAGYTHKGKRFWGSPWVPELFGHAFFAGEKELASSWSMIPSGLDVLITHTPPRAILDLASSGLALGCAELAKVVYHARPRVHCFGHIHHSRGQVSQWGTTFINASSVQRGRSGVLDPIVVEL